MADLLAALRIRSFKPLLATYTLNELADWVAAIAVAVLVFDVTGDPLATTALFVANKFLPGAVVPALAARLEGVPVRRSLPLIYAVEAACIGLLAVVAASHFSLPLVLLLALVDGALAATARAATRAATVAVLEPAGALREGNAALNVGFAVTNAGAPVAAGVLVAGLGEGAVLGLAAALFAGLAVVAARIDGVPVADEADTAGWRERLRAGAAHVRGRPVLRTLLITQTVLLVLFTMVAPIEVVFAKETLGAGDAGYGALLTAWGAGIVVGSAVFASERRRSIVLLVVASTLAVGVAYLGMAVAGTLAVACAAAVLGGAGNGVQWVAVVTALQEEADERFQARVAGLLEAAATAAPGAGFVLGGVITAVLSPRVAFAVAGTGVLAVLLLGAARMAPALGRARAGSEPVLDAALPGPLTVAARAAAAGSQA